MILNHFLLATIILSLSENLLYCLLSFKHAETVSSRAVSLVYVSNGCRCKAGEGAKKAAKAGLVFIPHEPPNSF